MTLTKIAGALLMASPFVGIAIYAVRTDGWKVMLGTYGVVLAVCGVLALGGFLWNL